MLRKGVVNVLFCKTGCFCKTEADLLGKAAPFYYNVAKFFPILFISVCI